MVWRPSTGQPPAFPRRAAAHRVPGARTPPSVCNFGRQRCLRRYVPFLSSLLFDPAGASGSPRAILGACTLRRSIFQHCRAGLIVSLPSLAEASNGAAQVHRGSGSRAQSLAMRAQQLQHARAGRFTGALCPSIEGLRRAMRELGRRTRKPLGEDHCPTMIPSDKLYRQLRWRNRRPDIGTSAATTKDADRGLSIPWISTLRIAGL